MENHVETIKGKVSAFVDHISGEVEVVKEFEVFAFSIMLKLLFSIDLECLEGA